MRARGPSTSLRTGFTLIEILLVCLLVATLAAIVAPSMSGSTQRSRLDATARMVVAFARAARAKASADGRAYFLVVDQEKREIRLSRARDPLAAPDNKAADSETEGDDWLAGAPWAQTIPFEDGVDMVWAMVAGNPFTGKGGAPPQPTIITAGAGYQTTVPGSGAGAVSDTQGTGISSTSPLGNPLSQAATGNATASTSTNYITMSTTGTGLTYPRITFTEEGTADDAFIDFEAGPDRVRIIVEPASGRCRILTQEEYDGVLAGATPALPTEKVPGQ